MLRLSSVRVVGGASALLLRVKIRHVDVVPLVKRQMWRKAGFCGAACKATCPFFPSGPAPDYAPRFGLLISVLSFWPKPPLYIIYPGRRHENRCVCGIGMCKRLCLCCGILLSLTNASVVYTACFKDSDQAIEPALPNCTEVAVVVARDQYGEMSAFPPVTMEFECPAPFSLPR